MKVVGYTKPEFRGTGMSNYFKELFDEYHIRQEIVIGKKLKLKNRKSCLAIMNVYDKNG